MPLAPLSPWSELPEVDDVSPSAPLSLELGADEGPDDSPDDKFTEDDVVDEAFRLSEDRDVVVDDEASVVLLLLEASILDM